MDSVPVLGTNQSFPEIGARFGRALVLSAVACFAWLVSWAIGQSLHGMGDVVRALLGGRGIPPEPASVWYQVGYYGEWVYGAVSLLVVLGALVESRYRVVLGGIWFLATLILASAGYVVFGGSIRAVAVGTGAVGAAWFWLATHARRRAA